MFIEPNPLQLLRSGGAKHLLPEAAFRSLETMVNSRYTESNPSRAFRFLHQAFEGED
jgi:hypothetical protein